MAYWHINSTTGNNTNVNNQGLALNKESSNDLSEFFENEEAVVLDVIADENHPEIKNLIPEEWPDNYANKIASPTDKNYTYVGRVKFRLLHSQVNLPKEKLSWAKPVYITGFVEIPLLNEVVVVTKYRNEWYYARKLNINGFVNNNANFNIEKTEGNTSGNRKDDINGNSYIPINGPKSYTGPVEIKNNENNGVLGSYFLANNKIRTVKKYEGDLSIESRFGQSIRFAAYDENRKNDMGSPAYPDYIGSGNPMIIIRNRQRPLGNDKKDTQLHPLLPPISKIKDVEKNSGGIIKEDINNDGSSIYITSGLTVSNWCTTVYKSTLSQTKGEEQSRYCPPNATNFNTPVLNGEQIIINSDRLILNSRFSETFHYSKKRYSVTTDSECVIDADDQIVITTNKKAVINAPAIYLGQYDETNEPALLGQTTCDWLYDLCEWLKIHVHWYNHTHPGTGNASPNKTQIPVQIAQIEALQARLKSTLSRRVFLTGGGYAPGADGVSPKNTDSGISPTKINILTGEGVPGGFKGENTRKKTITT